MSEIDAILRNARRAPISISIRPATEPSPEKRLRQSWRDHGRFPIALDDLFTQMDGGPGHVGGKHSINREQPHNINVPGREGQEECDRRFECLASASGGGRMQGQSGLLPEKAGKNDPISPGEQDSSDRLGDPVHGDFWMPNKARDGGSSYQR